jgi:hypothetical protein
VTASDSAGAPTTAIVHAADGIRFVATAACPDVLFAQLAAYVRGRCDDVLWADASRQIRTLLADGHLRAAITQYFAHSADRWDQEQLTLVTVTDGEYWIPDEERVADARR